MSQLDSLEFGVTPVMSKVARFSVSHNYPLTRCQQSRKQGIFPTYKFAQECLAPLVRFRKFWIAIPPPATASLTEPLPPVTPDSRLYNMIVIYDCVDTVRSVCCWEYEQASESKPEPNLVVPLNLTKPVDKV